MRRAWWVLMLCAAAAPAADVSGTWQLSYVRENGKTHVSTLALKMNGDQLSGTLSSPLGTAPVTTGKLTGNDITFTLDRRAQYDDIPVTYTGKVEGDTMTLEMQYSGRPAVKITGKRMP